MRKDQKPTSPPKSTSSRQLRSSTTAAAVSTPSKTSQKPSKPSPEANCCAPKAQKRKHADEAEHSQKRSRIDLPSASVPATASQQLVEAWQTGKEKQSLGSADNLSHKEYRESIPRSQLSEKNLRKLERGLKQLERGTDNDMSPRKRAPSRQASSTDLNQDTSTQLSESTRKSTISSSFYRYHVLEGVNLFVSPKPPPTVIQAQLDVIFKREIPEERIREISDIAQMISRRFIESPRGSHRENDLVEIVHEALRILDKDQTFVFMRKADWDPSLKPDVQKGLWDFAALGQPSYEAENIIDRPNKRQQGERSLPSPDTSRSAMLPPTAPFQPQQDTVKTPRPDFTVGLRHSLVSTAMAERGLTQYEADDFLRTSQREGRLCSNPTQNFLDGRFPILVIEGKSYATGKTVFEAQNQAAVSGSCMVNLQQQLSDLFKGVFPNLRGGTTHLAFSICTEGPHIEFWVHYSLSNRNVRSHYMNILTTCYGALQGGLKDFLMDVERLVKWTQEEYLKEVADQLYKLANHTARG